MVAVPLEVICARPSDEPTSQSVTAVSQKSTWPRVAAVPPELTLAVSVTTVPAVMVLTAVPLAEMVNEVELLMTYAAVAIALLA